MHDTKPFSKIPVIDFRRWHEGATNERQEFALPDEIRRQIDKRNSRQFPGWEQVGTQISNNHPDLFGDQNWNYFLRSYPQIAADHYSDVELEL